MYRKITLLACMGLAGWAHAFTPQSGTWVVNSELNGAPGRGIAIDVQASTLVMQMYAYEANGQPTFYMTSGTLNNNQMTGTLGRYAGGRYLGSPPLSGHEEGSPGNVTLRFTSGITGFITLPGEGEVQISRYDFGTSRTAEAMTGTWLYAVTGSSKDSAELVTLRDPVGAMAGTGFMLDSAKNFGCEFLAADQGPYNMQCGSMSGSTAKWTARIKLVGNEGEGIALDAQTGAQNGVVYVRKLINNQGQQLGFFAPQPPQATGLPTGASPSAPATPSSSYAGAYSISGGGITATFNVDSSGNIVRCSSGVLVICSGQVNDSGSFSLRGDDGDGTVVTLNGTIDAAGKVVGTYSGTSDGAAINGAFSGSGPAPSKGGSTGGGSSGTGKQAVAFCWMNTSKTMWFCDGPTQRLEVSWTHQEAMYYAGCKNGQQISIGHITLAQKSDNKTYVGPVYDCGFKLNSWDRDIRNYWSGSAAPW